MKKGMRMYFEHKQLVKAKNAKKTSKARFDLDKFADLSDDEFILKKTGLALDYDIDATNVHEEGIDEENHGRLLYDFDEIDWRHKITAVKD